MAALRYILLAAAITLTLALLAHLLLPARAPIPRCTGRRGGLGIAVLTAVYAVAAFWNLGSAHDPQRFCSFEAGESAVLALERETAIGTVWYYPGLSTGEYTLAYSTDGVTFTPAGTMPQGYADLFKWLQPEMTDTAPATAAYVRITASAHMELGELALYDLQGERIGVRAITGPAGADALCDEADTVPASSTYHNSTYFDEIYHARTAYEHLRGVYPYEVSHPPLGKEILSLGIVLFGMTPFGWRFMGTLSGVAMLPLMWDLLRRMFRDDRVAWCGAALLAFDFMHLTQTRIATIDSFATLFILLMYLFLYRYFTEGKLRHLAACGVTFGIGAATKWTCLYAGAGLGVLWALHWVFSGVRAHRAGDGRRYARRLLGNIGFCLVFFVLVPGMIYYASYYPYGAACTARACTSRANTPPSCWKTSASCLRIIPALSPRIRIPRAGGSGCSTCGRSSTTCRMATGRCRPSARSSIPYCAGAGCWRCRCSRTAHGSATARRCLSSSAIWRRCCRGCSSRA